MPSEKKMHLKHHPLDMPCEYMPCELPHSREKQLCSDWVRYFTARKTLIEALRCHSKWNDELLQAKRLLKSKWKNY